ncbi:MAG: PTS sugar transporter subunit IIC [Desulfomonile tiedjei]|uniref:PTS sugar transporter subunit IIC n=1 Tax=Desulfomonile tiedjei TaxID=2358 RepID=A0A9D6V4U1_9BACT|nr:PTS sugar transporter subunit IIC [Desulfomonile tiedjei]
MAGALGGLFWLDRFQVFQLMLSRPIVAAPVIGWALGDPLSGFASGLLYEVLWLERPPIGGYIPPDSTLASVATAAVSALAKSQSPAPLTAVVFVSFLCLFPVAFVGARLDFFLRSGLGKLARSAEQSLLNGSGIPVSKYLAGGLLLGFVCSFVVLFPVILVGDILVSSLLERCSAPVVRSFELSYYAVPLVGVAELMEGLREKRYIILFTVGLILALGVGFILGF